MSMTAKTDSPDDEEDGEFLASADLANEFIDTLCSDKENPFLPNKSPLVMLRALGNCACQISETFKIDLDDALAIIAKEARALEQYCREIEDEHLQ
jgi:hypothetical protein